MLPPRALYLPPDSHDDARCIELMNTCAERGLLTPTPLHIGLTQAMSEDRASLFLLVEARRPAQIAAWADRLHAHHASAALVFDDPDMVSRAELATLPGLGLWPVYTGGKEPLVSSSPAEIRRALDAWPRSPTIMLPRPNTLQIATDALLLEELARRGVTHLCIPEAQLTRPSHPRIGTSRYRRVQFDHDAPEQLIAWVEGDRLERARSGVRSLKAALLERF